VPLVRKWVIICQNVGGINDLVYLSLEKLARLGGVDVSINERVNVIPYGENNNVVDVILNDLFVDQAIIDTGSYLSFWDNSFVKMHKLCVTPIKPGMSRSYIAAGNTRITAIGKTDIVLTFAGEKFPFCFQVINNLSTS